MKDPIARKMRELARALDKRGDNAAEPWEFPHPDTAAIIDSRRTARAQFSHSVPEELQLHARLRQYCTDHDTRPGDTVAAIVDAALRAHGYHVTPDPDAEE